MKPEQRLIANYFESNEVRSFIDDEGVAWFHGTHICDVLEYQNPSVVIPANVEENDRKKIDIGLLQPVWFVNECGLYDLILGCRKKIAKPFHRWLSHNVLPSIRKTGYFIDESRYTIEQVENMKKAFEEITSVATKLVEDLEHEYKKKIDLLIYGKYEYVHKNISPKSFKTVLTELQKIGFVYDAERFKLAIKRYFSSIGYPQRRISLSDSTSSVNSIEFMKCIYESMRYEGDLNDSDESMNMKLFYKEFGIKSGIPTQECFKSRDTTHERIAKVKSIIE